MLDDDVHKSIGSLKARCMILESRVASLTALACALLESHPSRDIIQTQWAKHLGPALDQVGPGLGENEKKFASAVPGWVQHRLDHKYQELKSFVFLIHILRSFCMPYSLLMNRSYHPGIMN